MLKSNEIVIFDVGKKNFPFSISSQLSKSANNDDFLMCRFDDRIYGIWSFHQKAVSFHMYEGGAVN